MRRIGSSSICRNRVKFVSQLLYRIRSNVKDPKILYHTCTIRLERDLSLSGSHA